MSIASYEDISKAFSYDPETGIITRNIATKQNAIGTECTSRGKSCLLVNYKHFDGTFITLAAHRVAYILMIGCWPEGAIDHIDGDPFNNVWTNLRIATKAQNTQNSKLRSDNTVGYKGVSPCGEKYRAVIYHNRKQKHLGLFDTAKAAHEAYCAEAQRLFGDFMCTG